MVQVSLSCRRDDLCYFMLSLLSNMILISACDECKNVFHCSDQVIMNLQKSKSVFTL